METPVYEPLTPVVGARGYHSDGEKFHPKSKYHPGAPACLISASSLPCVARSLREQLPMLTPPRAVPSRRVRSRPAARSGRSPATTRGRAGGKPPRPSIKTGLPTRAPLSTSARSSGAPARPAASAEVETGASGGRGPFGVRGRAAGTWSDGTRAPPEKLRSCAYTCTRNARPKLKTAATTKESVRALMPRT